MELIIGAVEYHVDTTLGTSTAVFKDAKGRTHCDFTHLLNTKYELIFRIAYHLTGDFKQMREYILQLIADMMDDSKKLIDIADFQVKLVETFDLKGILSSYRNDSIPAPKKSLAVNETKFKKDAGEKKDDPA